MKTKGVVFRNGRETATFTMEANGVLRISVSSMNANKFFAVELGTAETRELRELLTGEK